MVRQGWVHMMQSLGVEWIAGDADCGVCVVSLLLLDPADAELDDRYQEGLL